MIEGLPRVVYFALRPMRTGGELIPEGSILPAASTWKNIHMNISQGQVAPLPTWLLTPEQQEGVALALGLIEAEPTVVDEAVSIVEQEAEALAEPEAEAKVDAEPTQAEEQPAAEAPETPQEPEPAAKGPSQPKGRNRR